MISKPNEMGTRHASYNRARHASPLQTKLLEITQIGPTRAGMLDIPEKHWPEPGQYLPCQRLSDASEVLMTHPFRILEQEGALTLEPIPQDWFPGDEIQYLPPEGRAFQLPTSVQRVGLLPFGVSPFRLLTLVKPALAQDASIILFFNPAQRNDYLSFVPSQVEVVPLTALKDNLDWLDYLAADLKREDIEELSYIFGPSPHSFTGQALIRTMMPCRGLADCGVCAVKTTKGWRLACKDGPVFPLREVLHVAQ